MGRGRRSGLQLALAMLAVPIVAGAAMFGTNALAYVSPAAGNLPFQFTLPSVQRGATATPAPTATATPIPTPKAIAVAPSARFGSAPVAGVDATVTTLMQESGAKLARQTFWWDHIEPNYAETPSFRWSAYYDGVLARLGNAGLDTVLTVGRNPTWAATTFCGPIDKTNGIAGFKRFLTAAAQRYSQPPYNIWQWEFYSEADGTDLVWQHPLEFGGHSCFGDHPEAYVEVLRAAHETLHGVYANLGLRAPKVMMGGLAHEELPLYGGQLFNINFMDELLQVPGASNYFDAAGVHYYSDQNLTWSPQNTWYYGMDIAGKVGHIQQQMAARGVNKPVAVTELSWNNWSSDPYSAADADAQARYLPKLLARSIFRELDSMIWFALSDGSDFLRPWGLVKLNREPRPAYYALKRAMSEIGSATAVREIVPSQIGVTDGVEGYAFAVRDEEVWLLWAKSEDAQIAITLPGGAYEAKDKLGANLTLNNLRLNPSPIYVHVR